MDVKVTVTIGGRAVPVDELRDPRIAGGVRSAGKDLGQKLDRVKCPIHSSRPTNVRLHFDASGVADLKYESCCEALGKAVGKALG